ncbi:formylglycine-generating enzyme family protein [Treponema sp. OMZ 788]|nr:formylglycine-generating enzyme family protein [Treponema sp. OMZ 788]
MIKLNLNKSSAASSGRLCALKRAAALITAALIAVLMFTGCPNSAGGSGGGTTPPAPSADKTYTVGGVSFTMKDIAAVTNGTVGHTDNTDNNAPHTVSLTAYRIGETEVTQELWHAVMGNNPSNFSGSPEGSEVQGKRPVENVNWYQCIAFCNKLSKACNLDPCYTVTGVNFDTLNFSAIPTSDDSDWNNAVLDMSKNGFRLPTEAEWEWAAKGGTNDKWAGTNEEAQLVNYAWYDANSGNKTHQVKLKSANGYGLYDMSGNVWEWCWDWSDSLSYPLPPDYEGAASGDDRVLRGGGWDIVAGYAARAFRVSGSPDKRGNSVGLRLVSRP